MREAINSEGGLVRIAEKIKINRAEREAWRRKCEEDAVQRRQRERLRQEEEIRLANLQKGFEQWMRADNLRRYIDAVRSLVLSLSPADINLQSVLRGWRKLPGGIREPSIVTVRVRISDPFITPDLSEHPSY